MNNQAPTRILIVEDLPSDVELARRELLVGGFEHILRHVDTEAEFRRQLAEFKPDIILSDYSLPEFDGRRALEIARQHDSNLPFIMLTGSINEATAVECMKAGAIDYLIKGQTKRLVFAIREALDQKRLRSARAEAERALRESEARIRFLADNIIDILWMFDPQIQRMTYISSSAERMLGYTVEELMELGPREVFLGDYAEDVPGLTRQRCERFLAAPADPAHATYTDIMQQRRKDGSAIWAEMVTRYLLTGPDEITIIGITRDITERKSNEAQLRLQGTALESASNAILITDPRCVIEWANPAFARLSGHSLEECMGRNSQDLLPVCPECEPEHAAMLASIAAGKSWSGQLRRIRRNGESFVEEASVTPVLDDRGIVRHYVTIKQDVTERVRSQQALRLSEERYELAARAANDALWDWDLLADRLYLAPRYYEMLGYDPSAGPHSREVLEESVHPADRSSVIAARQACIDGATPRFEEEYRLRHADGSYRWVRARGLVVRDASDRPIRFAGSLSDITERKVAEEQLLFDAFHDSLTGLPNRALFFDRLENAVRRRNRDSSSWFAVMVLDLDRFKLVNDSLGHLVGDKLLQKIGERIETCIRASDTLARLGGDEFAILLEGQRDDGSAFRIADRIVRELSAPLAIEGREISTTASIGIAFGTSDYPRAEEILRDADIALYRAKAAGRSRYEIFNPEMHRQALSALEMEQDLRLALQRGELNLHYQPVVKLATGRVHGFEALLRWRRGTHGFVSPAEFIPIAEETGLIVQLGEWVLCEACECLRRIDAANVPGAGRLQMSVNLSARQVYEAGIVDRVRGIVADAGCLPERIVLEITESVLMDRPEFAAAVLHQFADAGFPIHLDDFGTGYSSMKYVMDFPIHSIKLDRSFVRQVPDDARSLALVRSILFLASQLNLGVTAEGVETLTQLASLRELHCDKVQGYFLSRALPEAEALELLRRDPTW